MHFNIAACLWTDHFILLKALDHLFLAKQKKTCRSDQVEGRHSEAAARVRDHQNLRPDLKAAGAVTALLGEEFLIEGEGGWWLWVRQVCTLAGQPRAPSDTEALQEGAGTPGLILFSFFFCDNQSLTTAATETQVGWITATRD